MSHLIGNKKFKITHTEPEFYDPKGSTGYLRHESNQPSDEFEFKANSLGAHIETHGGLILRTLSQLIANSKADSHGELAVSFL